MVRQHHSGPLASYVVLVNVGIVELLLIMPGCELKETDPLEQAHLFSLHVAQVRFKFYEALLLLN